AVAGERGPTLHCPPAQPLRAKRLVEPGGVVLSGTCEMPPPSERLPQSRFFSGTVPATSRNVWPHVPVAAVERKSNLVAGPPPPIVVVVVDVVVVVVGTGAVVVGTGPIVEVVVVDGATVVVGTGAVVVDVVVVG